MIEQISLPYSLSSLEPVISSRTVEFHFGKHLKGYVDNLNRLISGTKYEGMELEEIVRSSEGGVFNNAGQILNHNLYFTQFRPYDERTDGNGNEGDVESSLVRTEGTEGEEAASENPEGELRKQIISQWGSVAEFRKEFEAKGTSLFGSGWVWLSADKDGTLHITQEAGASNPVTKGLCPILTFDVWEHAYYLDYQNRRAAHLAELWKIVDWSVLEKRYSSR